MSKTEQYFEQLVKDKGYTIKAIREYLSKTEYLLDKDGTEFEYAYYLLPNDVNRTDKKYAEYNVYRLNENFDMYRLLTSKD